MTDLSPHTRKLIELATRAEAPSSSARQRCERRLQRRLSAAMGLAAGVAVAETAAAHSVAVKSAIAKSAVVKATLGSGALGSTAAVSSGSSLGAGALVGQLTALLSSVSAKVVVSTIALAATASLGHELIEQLDSPTTKTPVASSAAAPRHGTAPRSSATRVTGNGSPERGLAEQGLAEQGLAGPDTAATLPEQAVPTASTSKQRAKLDPVSPPQTIAGNQTSARERPNAGTPHRRSDLMAQVEALEHAERLLHTGQEEAALRVLKDSENEHGSAANDLSGERRALRALVLCASQSAERRAAGRAEAARSLALDPRGSLAPRLTVECAEDDP